MPTFKYKAYNTGGKTIAGAIEAAGVKDAIERLKNSGLYPTDVKEAFAGKKYLGARSGITTNVLALTTRQLATLLSAGTNLSEALTVLTENTANEKLKSVLLRIKESVMEGSSLSKSLESHPEIFSTFYRGLVAAGEASGSLDKVLPRLADYLEARARIIRDVKAALTYPVLMTLVGVSVLSFLFIFVIPKITRMFEETQSTLPLITRFLIGVTTLFKDYWLILLIAIAAGTWITVKYLSTRRGRTMRQQVSFKIPWFGGIIRDFYISNFARTLGSLLKGGVHMLKALEITNEVIDHSVFRNILDTAIRDCTGGSSLSISLKKQTAIPPIVVHMISVGEKSGTLDEMLLKTAESYELDFEANVKKTLNLLEPILILVMGLAVGFIVLAILLPIFQLNQIIH